MTTHISGAINIMTERKTAPMSARQILVYEAHISGLEHALAAAVEMLTPLQQARLLGVVQKAAAEDSQCDTLGTCPADEPCIQSFSNGHLMAATCIQHAAYPAARSPSA